MELINLRIFLLNSFFVNRNELLKKNSIEIYLLLSSSSFYFLIIKIVLLIFTMILE